MPDLDPYVVLGVPPNATPDQIREAYLGVVGVVQPDRFDPEHQAREWQQAHEVLEEATRAYETLRDPASRARHDGRHAGGPAEPRAADAADGGPTAGQAPLNRLPPGVQQRLAARQADRIPEQASVATARVWWRYGLIAAALLWFWILLAIAVGERWPGDGMAFLGAVTALATVGLGRQVDWLWRWRKATLKARLYATPLYIVETDRDDVRWWPLWTLQDVRATHHYRNGGYQHTSLSLVFPAGTRHFTITSQQGADRLLGACNAFDQHLRMAAEQNRWDYFEQQDDFRGATSHPIARAALDGSGRKAYGGAAALGLAVMTAAFAINVDNPLPLPLTGPPPSAYADAGYGAPTAEPVALPPFEEPVQPLPANGAAEHLGGGEPVAPLEIRTRAGDTQHYYVKVSDWSTGEPVATLFVQAGQTAETLVPVGTYRLRYATGGTWYGDRFLFGPETAYSEAAESFTFTSDASGVSGYTVDLYLQQDGNLDTRAIRPDQW